MRRAGCDEGIFDSLDARGIGGGAGLEDVEGGGAGRVGGGHAGTAHVSVTTRVVGRVDADTRSGDVHDRAVVGEAGERIVGAVGV